MTYRCTPVICILMLVCVQPIISLSLPSAPRLASAGLRTPAPQLFDEELNLIYDSKCGICEWEVQFLRDRDTDGRLTYTDLESPDFEEGSARNGFLDYETALGSFHAVRSDGTVLSGMPVFQAAYAAVGLGWVWAIYDNPVAAKIFDMGYSLFARYRTDLTRGSSLEVLISQRRALAAGECEPCRLNNVSGKK